MLQFHRRLHLLAWLALLPILSVLLLVAFLRRPPAPPVPASLAPSVAPVTQPTPGRGP